jgi:hypothetical protein
MRAHSPLHILRLLQEPKKDYAAVRKAIENVLDADDYDDGSYGEQRGGAQRCLHF